MPRPEGIATVLARPVQILQLSRNECPDQRGLRPFPALLGRTFSECRNECPDQRGLRLFWWSLPVLLVQAGTNAPTRGDCDEARSRILTEKGSAGTNAPTRGDCDGDHRAFSRSPDVPERMPRPEGIATPPSCSLRSRWKWPERMPRPEGIATQSTRSRTGPGRGRNECPDQRGLRLSMNCLPLFCPNWPERMPRPEGIATQSTLLVARGSVRGPERMPRPEGIATLHQLIIESLFTSRNECPDQRGLRPLGLSIFDN